MLCNNVFDIGSKQNQIPCFPNFWLLHSGAGLVFCSPFCGLLLLAASLPADELP
jgi:hypothetical protein